MGLLKSIDNVPGLDYYEYRDSSYYNKYEYRLRAKIPCIRYTWWCKKPEDLDKKIAGNSKEYGSIRTEDVTTVVDHAPALKAVIKLQGEKKKKQIGIRIESNTLAIFSNDLSILKDIEKEIGGTYDFDYTQSQTSQYAGIKHFVNDPPHKYRVYLRSKRVDDNFRDELTDLFQRLPTLYPSTALNSWLLMNAKRWGAWKFRWTSGSHFIDYDDESTLSYLALMHGDILGKKYKLEKRPDTI